MKADLKKNMDAEKIWERKDDESDKAFEAFQTYLNMGSDRSFQGVAEELSKSSTIIRRWNRRYKWRERVDAYENSIAEEARGEAVKSAVNTGVERIWDRQEGESDKAYEAFQVYLNLGSDRTIDKVVKKLKKSATILNRWCAAYKWRERVTAYENSIIEEARDAAIKETKKMVKRHINIAMKMQSKALQAMSNLTPQDMKVTDIRDFIKLATDLERQNRLVIDDEENDDGLKENMMVRIYLPEKDEEDEE